MISEIFNLQNPWRTQNNYQFNLQKREILKELINNLSTPKIIGLIGSRQVGKSSLLFSLIKYLIKDSTNKSRIFYFNLDDLFLHQIFENITDLINFISPGKETKYLFIDEIQRLPNPWLFLKELYDLKLNLKIFYSWSSQLEIKSKLKEHLVGRVRQFEIQRLSLSEYIDFRQPITKKQALYDYLTYGSYPEIAQTKGEQNKILAIKDIYQSYIQKDINEFLQVKNTETFNKLIILLANQIGSLLNIDNLAKTLRSPRAEIIKYIEILEWTFIIKLIYPYFKNYKKEITKTPKLFFLDLWLRNFALNNFNSLELRSDKGELFENFVFLDYLTKDVHWLHKINFWRTTNQTEIDFIIQTPQQTEAIETKWTTSKTPKSFTTLLEHYPDFEAKIVNKDNYLWNFK